MMLLMFALYIALLALAAWQLRLHYQQQRLHQQQMKVLQRQQQAALDKKAAAPAPNNAAIRVAAQFQLIKWQLHILKSYSEG